MTQCLASKLLRVYVPITSKTILKPGIAAPPASDNVLDTVYQNLKIKDPGKLFPLDGNDTIGDCTIAALAHAITVYRALLKTKKIMTQAAVEKLYYHLTGGPDTGLNELDVLNYWRANPVAADEILAYVKIDPKNLHAWRMARVARINADFQFEVVYTTPGPLPPEPFPATRSRRQWETYLNELYERWGGRWESPRR